VDMDRLKDLTDGNEENLRELVELYIKQTGEQMEQIQTAVQANRTDEVRRVAHSCAGASATCGITRLVPLLRELERQGQEGKLTNAEELSRQATKEFEQVRTFLSAQLSLLKAPAVQITT
jgi:HPt (histidine-containing phosphotransfer) domain-containing protein